ncbi:MAG: lytic transglycosylase domain-containing protein [Mobilicoccus sp.]|nr:lytic transglycosylase domain-containing protein [Mobilicoccus sp.]
MSRRDTLSRIIDRLGRFERPGRPTSVRRPSRAVWVAVTATAIAVPLAAAVEPRTIEFEAAPTPVSPVANGGVPVLPWLTVAQQGVTFPAGFTLGGVGDGTIPPTMLAAYRQAESALAQSSPSCNLPWWLLAGIGHVESGHAAGGNVDESGRTLGDIYGVVLDGTTPDTAVVLDTDGGEIDGDDTYDRAVGPMQFLPSTWQLFGTDGNDDGIVDPHNIYDATRSAGEYLCSFGGDLSTGEAMRAAVLGYNPSDQYVQDVIAAGEAYRDGRTPPPLWTPPTVPPGSPPPPVIVADGPVDAYDTDWWNDGWDEAAWDDALWDDDHGAQAVAPRRASARPAPVRAPQPAPAPPATPAPTATPSPTDTPTAAPTDAPAPTGTPTTVPSPTTTPSTGSPRSGGSRRRVGCLRSDGTRRSGPRRRVGSGRRPPRPTR